MKNNATIGALILIVCLQFSLIYNLKHKITELQKQQSNKKDVMEEESKTPEIPKPPEAPAEDKKPQEVTTYNEALSNAKINKKKIFVYFEAKWCVNCTKMNSETLADKDVQSKLADYIVVHIDVDKERKLARQYEVYGVPHFLVIDDNELRHNVGTGFMSKDNFMDWLDKKQKMTSQTPSKDDPFTILQPDP